VAALVDSRLLARTWAAFALDCLRYRIGVAPVVRRELCGWHERAQQIPDPALRELALGKLAQEGFHAEAGAMLATPAPRAQRGGVVRAIVALELLYDYLDGRSEAQDLEEGRRLFAVFTGALAEPGTDQASEILSDAADRAYLLGLAGAVRDSLAQLPAVGTVRAALRDAAAHGSEAQLRVHTGAEVESWARSQASGTGLQWREFLAGAAASVIACHALIAAGAREGIGHEEARELAAAYLPLCALTTLLDGLVDHQGDPQDAMTGGREGEDGYIGFYPDRHALAAALSGLADGALTQARGRRDGAHHVAMVAGVVAYYATAPGARSGFARGVIAQLRGRFGLLILPMIALMRAWRAARRARGR
jgi:tetraprenyl-beta-curcumene synthase